MNTKEDVMMERVGNSNDVVAGTMLVFDVAGNKVNVASVGGHLHAFDDTCTHKVNSKRWVTARVTLSFSRA